MLNIEKNKLTNLIELYHQDQELNRLKDILDYLKKGPLYMPATIKISKKKLLTIPCADMILLLEGLETSLKKNKWPVYSNASMIKTKYTVALNFNDCLLLMNKFGNVKEIIIDPNHQGAMVIDESLIKYLKN